MIQRSDAGEAQTHGLSVWSQALQLSHCAPQNLMCWSIKYVILAYLQEEIAKLNRKLERSKKIEMAGAADEVLMAEIGEYKVAYNINLFYELIHFLRSHCGVEDKALTS